MLSGDGLRYDKPLAASGLRRGSLCFAIPIENSRKQRRCAARQAKVVAVSGAAYSSIEPALGNLIQAV
jgi:hypothetical protein